MEKGSFSLPSEFLWFGNSSLNTRRKRRKQPKVPPASPICQHLSLPWAAPCSCCGPRQLFYNFISFSQQPECVEQLGLACPRPDGSPQTQGPMGKQIDGAITLKCWRRCQASERTSAVGEATRLQISCPSALYKNLSARAKEAKGEETDIGVTPGNQGTGVVSPCLATHG